MDGRGREKQAKRREVAPIIGLGSDFQRLESNRGFRRRAHGSTSRSSSKTKMRIAPDYQLGWHNRGLNENRRVNTHNLPKVYFHRRDLRRRTARRSDKRDGVGETPVE